MFSGCGDAVDDHDDDQEEEAGSAESVEVVSCELTDVERLISVCNLSRRVGEVPKPVITGGYDGLVGNTQDSLH